MSRIFWQMFALLFSVVVGGCVWLVAHMLDTAPGIALSAAAIAFLGLEVCMARFLAAHVAPDAPELQDPWEHGREILHQEHVPAILHRNVTGDDVTQVLNPAAVHRYQGRRRLNTREIPAADRTVGHNAGLPDLRTPRPQGNCRTRAGGR